MMTIHPIHLSHPIHQSHAIHQQRSKRWQKDDKKMTGRCQKDLKEMTKGWQKDVRKIRERRMLLLLLNILYYIISLLLLTSKEKALQSVTSLPSVCAWKHLQENFIFKPTSPLNDNHQEAETCTVKKRRRRWCCWEACAILKLHWRYTRHLVGWPSSDIKNKFFDSLFDVKCITDPLIQPILIGSDECKTVD